MFFNSLKWRPFTHNSSDGCKQRNLVMRSYFLKALCYECIEIAGQKIIFLSCVQSSVQRMLTYVFMMDSNWFNQVVTAVHRSTESQWEDSEQDATPDPHHGFQKPTEALPHTHTHSLGSLSKSGSPNQHTVSKCWCNKRQTLNCLWSLGILIRSHNSKGWLLDE